MARMRYRLALDLGSTSLGWAMVRLNPDNAPCAVIKAGVRIFSDGRNPKDGSSLAVTRRDARAMRRRTAPSEHYRSQPLVAARQKAFRMPTAQAQGQ